MMKNQNTPVQLTKRQRRITDLYDGGRRTQSEVAKELGISRATVARELRYMCEEHILDAMEAIEPSFYEKVLHHRDLTFDAEFDYRPFGSPPLISRSTAYRRTAKEWGKAPEQIDKTLHELKIACRAINRALKLIEANDREATEAACQEREKIRDLIMCFYD